MIISDVFFCIFKRQKKTLDIDRKSLPPDHRLLAVTYNNIIRMHCSLRDYSMAAAPYLERALVIQ